VTAAVVSGAIGVVLGCPAGYWILRPLGWRLFRWVHRNDPAALEFADRKDPR
jgi:membrane protein DedA with SNARE-associated domain